jgi:glucokinase
MVARLKAPDFVSAFTGKGRLRGFLENVPVHVIVEPNVGLYGAAAVALNL